jgi:predicted flap endonuclease-1-like 5' DNA nuclease
MSGLSIYWFLVLPLLSEPTGEAPIIPLWIWIFFGLIIIGLPILTVAFGPGLRRKAVAKVVVPLPEHAPEVPPAAHAAPEGVASAEHDDLTRIEGIGPEIARTLQEADITTFDALGTTSVDKLAAILEQNPRLRLADPTSWPQQAILAAVGDWDELEKLQAELKGGRGTM